MEAAGCWAERYCFAKNDCGGKERLWQDWGYGFLQKEREMVEGT